MGVVKSSLLNVPSFYSILQGLGAKLPGAESVLMLVKQLGCAEAGGLSLNSGCAKMAELPTSPACVLNEGGGPKCR